MERPISRRSFLKKTAIALSTVAVCHSVERIESRSGLHQLEYIKTLNMGNDQYELVTL